MVGDEETGKAESSSQPLQELDHLRLDRDVERRQRLVADDHFRSERDGAGYGDALPLSAGELVGVAPCVLGLQPHAAQEFLNAHRPFGLRQRSEEDTSELQSLMRISYAVFC